MIETEVRALELARRAVRAQEKHAEVKADQAESVRQLLPILQEIAESLRGGSITPCQNTTTTGSTAGAPDGGGSDIGRSDQRVTPRGCELDPGRPTPNGWGAVLDRLPDCPECATDNINSHLTGCSLGQWESQIREAFVWARRSGWTTRGGDPG